MTEDGARIGPYALVRPVVRTARFGLFNAVRADGKERGPREVAIRVLKDPQDREASACLLREHQRLSELGEASVPHAIALYEGHGALVMDWVEGIRLADLLRARDNSALTLDDATILEMGLALVKVLRVAHGRPTPVIHARLAPGNVVLDEAGRLTQLGWGAWSTVSWTIGVAPEARIKGAIDARTDVFGLGVLLAALFEPRKLRSSGIGPTVQIITQRWPAAGRLLEEMTAHSPADRPASAEAVLARLLTLARQQGGTARVAAVVGDCARWLREGRSGGSPSSGRPSSPFPSDPADGDASGIRPFEQAGATAEPEPLQSPLIIRSGPSLSSASSPADLEIELSKSDLWEEAEPGPLVVVQDEAAVPDADLEPTVSAPATTAGTPTFLDVPKAGRIEPIIDDEPTSQGLPPSETGAQDAAIGRAEPSISPREPARYPSEDEDTDHGQRPKLSVPEWIAVIFVGILLLGLVATLLRAC
jgi:hypothetical protein